MSLSPNQRSLLQKALGLGNGETPFPWQEELLERMLKGEVPELVDIPTGLGKTAVMAIWLVARACRAQLPRRLVYVVDRRAVVDQATEVALSLRGFVEDDREVKNRLGLRDDQPLPISTLRGQYVDNREWLEDPAAPAIIVGTVDMVGSRLLFQGYGVSRKMRPYHAGLLGVDTLVVLDEAHLVPPFEHLLQSVATDTAFRPWHEPYRPLLPRFQLLALSATRRGRSGDVVRLTEKDFEHDIVERRLNARKSLHIKPLDGETRLEEELANYGWKLTDDGKNAVRVLIYSDSREIARKAKHSIEKLTKRDGMADKIETELFVGGRRVFEREDAKKWLESHGFIAGSTVERSAPVFLFATSAGEVGVDLDADHMVCDLVAWERMVQRLGRVNRRGEGQANVVVILEREPENADQLLARSGDGLTAKEHETVERIRRLRAVRSVLEQLQSSDSKGFDVSPGALYDLKTGATTDNNLQRVLDEATTPEPLRPALSRPLLEAWAMTCVKEHTGRPDIQPWLRGWVEDEPPQTAVVWRRHLPIRTDGPTPSKKEIEAFFEAAPPHASELLETETFRVLKWLAARAKSVRKQQAEQDVATAEPRLGDKDVVAFALAPDGDLRRSFRLDELAASEDKNKEKNVEDALKGATLILDARLGGLRAGLLEDAEATVPRTADDGCDWLGEGVVGFRVRRVEASAVVQRERKWRERFRFPSALTEDGETTKWLIVEKWRHDAANEEDRSAANPQLLDEHQAWAEERARSLTEALGLDGELADALAVAARLHDEGKRALRWQRSFRAPKDGVYAKTEGPIDYRLLDGYRHELGSLLRVENDERIRKLSEEHRDLVLHLIAAHHGFARPVIGTSGCEDSPPSLLEEKAAEIALRFARLQERWGPWGLAWWEGLLRAADQQASRDNDAGASAGGDR
jgi:CRISPR-associated endonuclease/helicase Cas3